MRAVYLSLGLLTLSLGTLGIFLPILPTTPFLLATAYFFARGSTRFHIWFTSTKLYQLHLQDFVEHRTMSKTKKWTLLLSVSTMMLLTFIFVDNLYVRIFIILVEIIKYWYFQTRAVTI
ncbi:MAG: DUF454 domain-containing protein [Methanomicrobia archaeon]|nr:DUF454 domain-containing protein [Methanomicrobia archaeon]